MSIDYTNVLMLYPQKENLNSRQCQICQNIVPDHYVASVNNLSHWLLFNVTYRHVTPYPVPSFHVPHFLVMTLPVLSLHVSSHSNLLCTVCTIVFWPVPYFFIWSTEIYWSLSSDILMEINECGYPRKFIWYLFPSVSTNHFPGSSYVYQITQS